MAKALASLELTGFEEVVKNFETLEEKVKKKALRPALRAGGKVIMMQAKRNAHTLSGRNKKFIKVKALKKSRRVIGVAIQTGTREELQIPRSEKGYYPFSEEFGTRTKAAHPFLRPALESKRQESLKVIARHLEKNMPKLLTTKSRSR